jgi:hypothetical protein
MHADELPIPEPCHEDWSTMTGPEKRRFCNACSKHVHDLSAMTAAEAKETLSDEPDICVRYTVNEDGTLVHTSSRRYFFKAAAGALLLGATPAMAAGLVQPEAEDGVLTSLKDKLLAWWNGEGQGCALPQTPVLMGEPAYVPPNPDVIPEVRPNPGVIPEVRPNPDVIPEVHQPVVRPPTRYTIKGKPAPQTKMGVVARKPVTPQE